MKSLQGKISATELSRVNEATSLRFISPFDYSTPEALLAYEQGVLDTEELKYCCELEYGKPLEIISPGFVSTAILKEFEKSTCVPFSVDTARETIRVATLYELPAPRVFYKSYSLEVHYVPIFNYVELWSRLYGEPKFLRPLAPKDYFDFLVEEATTLGASDVTISQTETSARVYYSVRKKKIHSRRFIPKALVPELIHYIANKSKRVIPRTLKEPSSVSLDLNQHFRGRALLNRTYYGDSSTIRVIPNELFRETLTTLNIDQRTQDFIHERMLAPEPGLRLVIGEPSSGKNTTILAMLSELVSTDEYKIVSIENPVENLIDGVEQINCDTEGEVTANTESLIRQNPSIVYITEIVRATAVSTINISNVAKLVFSSVHASSISLVLTRLSDLTGIPQDRLLMTLHSCIFQELVRDDAQDKLFPRTRCLWFSDELKAELIGKTSGEIYLRLKEEEDKWIS